MMLDRLGVYARILRPEQYYKNLVIFLAIYFSGNILSLSKVMATGVGFVVLCILSSANYIINDIVDKTKDKYNKEKADRPIASGKVTVQQGIAIASALAIISLAASYLINNEFFLFALSFFLLTSLYTFLLKKEVFLDIIAIASNFVIRAMAGAAVIGVKSSPWLVVGTFFLALFLAAGKRKSEKTFLKGKTINHRPLLESYSDQNLTFLLQMSATVVLISYTLYSFLGTKPQLVFSLPFAIYPLLRYLHLLESGSQQTRDISGIIKDWRIMLSAAAYLAISFAILYVH